MRIRKFHRGDAPRVSRLMMRALLEVNSKDYPKKVIDFMCHLFTPRNLIEISSRRDMYVVIHEGKVLARCYKQGVPILSMKRSKAMHAQGQHKRIPLAKPKEGEI